MPEYGDGPVPLLHHMVGEHRRHVEIGGALRFRVALDRFICCTCAFAVALVVASEPGAGPVTGRADVDVVPGAGPVTIRASRGCTSYVVWSCARSNMRLRHHLRRMVTISSLSFKI